VLPHRPTSHSITAKLRPPICPWRKVHVVVPTRICTRLLEIYQHEENWRHDAESVFQHHCDVLSPYYHDDDEVNPDWKVALVLALDKDLYHTTTLTDVLDHEITAHLAAENGEPGTPHWNYGWKYASTDTAHLREHSACDYTICITGADLRGNMDYIEERITSTWSEDFTDVDQLLNCFSS
jgi:hypothetical protein